MAKPTVSKKLRFDVLERDGFRCRYCGAAPEDGALHVDHIIPVAHGGKTELPNLVTSCEPCNNGKGTRDIGEAQPLPDLSDASEDAERVAASVNRWRRAHKKREAAVKAAAKQIISEHGLTIPVKQIEAAIREYGVAEVDYAADAVERKDFAADEYRSATSYLHAVLRNRRADSADDAPMPKRVDHPKAAGPSCPFEIPCSMKCCVNFSDGRWECCSWLLEQVGGWENLGHAQAVGFFVSDWRHERGVKHITGLVSERDNALYDLGLAVGSK